MYFLGNYIKLGIEKTTIMLNDEIAEKIKSFVYQQPRSMAEIAFHIDKNWRTADRYVEEIISKTGYLRTKTFREGSRGALKVVYWNNTEKVYATDVQKELFEKIERAIDKSDFSPFDIYQYVDSEKRKAYSDVIEDEKTYDYDIGSLVPFFEEAEKNILIFAGNMSLIHLEGKGKKIIDYMGEAVDRGVRIQIITNITQADMKNVESVLALNNGLSKPLVEIRHDISPLRAYIFDDNVIRLGEVDANFRKEGQISGVLCTYYEIRDTVWVRWMQDLFWKDFHHAILAKRRIDSLRTIGFR